jgi:hypothetical protein
MPKNDDLPLLTYGFSTDPIPVAISTDQVVNQARVNIGVSASKQVYCNQILVAVPIGSDGASLFAKTPAGSLNTKKWTITSQVKKGSELGMGALSDQDYATFTYDCISSIDYLINYNLVFGVFGAVDDMTGDAGVMIQENSGTTSDPSTFTPKVGTFPVSKELPQFYLKNLVATAPSSPTVPTTDFANGASIRFAWESNGSYFQLYMKDQTAPIYSGTATTCTLPGISRDTTFILAASMTASPGQDIPQGGYQPIYLYDSLGITVSNPVLTPTSVNVASTLGVTGTSTLGVTNTGALTSASATVTGSLQAGSVSTNGTLNATGQTTLGQATVNGSLTVNSGSTLSGATVNGTLNGTGSASLTNLTVRGLTGTGGRVALVGRGTMLAQGTTVNNTQVYAQTDGFAIANVLTPGNNGKSSFAYGQLYVVGTWFQVLGGTVGSFGSSWSYVMNNNPNAITIPIQAGTYWQYAGANPAGNQLNSAIQIWWFPMGGSSSSEQTFRIVSEEEAGELVAPPPVPDFNALISEDQEAAVAFVERLAAALDAELAEEVRDELARLLRGR